MRIKHLCSGMVLVLWTSMCAYSENPNQATDQTNPMDTVVESTHSMDRVVEFANPTSDFEYKQSNGEITITGVKNTEISDSVVIPPMIDGLPATVIGAEAFACCRKLKSVTIPNSVTTIGVKAFRSCEGLMLVTIPDGVTSIGDSAFGGCSSLMSVTVPRSVTSIGKDAFG